MKKLSLIIMIGIFCQGLMAQSFYNRRIDRSWVVSFGTGSAKYFGDLANPGEIFQSTKWNIEGGLEKRFDPRFSARANLTILRLSGDDGDASEGSRNRRNLNFKSTNIEFAVVGMAQLFPESGRYYQRKLFNAFVFAGLGAVYFNPKTDIPATDHNGNAFPDAGKMTSLRKLKTELVSYTPITLVIPAGVGVKFMVSPFMNISINGGYRFTFSDYLDDISTVHSGDAAFSNPLAAALSDRRPEIGKPVVAAGLNRGNSSNNDGYFVFSIRAEYYLPPTVFGGGPRNFKKKKYRRAKSREP